MATIEELETNGTLVKIEVPLDLGYQPWRRIYGLPTFIQWLENDLPLLQTTIIGGDSEPLEQVDAVLNEYVRGDHLSTDHRFKKLSWTPDLSVWEFKTPDIRIFGWVPAIDVFICCFGDHKDQIELMRSYGTYQARTSYVRSQMDLNEPKAIVSKEYLDVLSDAH
jgi:hypothetical protein